MNSCHYRNLRNDQNGMNSRIRVIKMKRYTWNFFDFINCRFQTIFIIFITLIHEFMLLLKFKERPEWHESTNQGYENEKLSVWIFDNIKCWFQISLDIFITLIREFVLLSKFKERPEWHEFTNQGYKNEKIYLKFFWLHQL